jgi:hypothetical protein
MKQIISLVVIIVMLDMGYSFLTDQTPPPDPSVGVSLEHQVYFIRAKHLDCLVLTNHRSAPLRAALLNIDGEPVKGGAFVSPWRPFSLTLLLSGYLYHLTKKDFKSTETAELYLQPGESMTVMGSRSLGLAYAEVLIDGVQHAFSFE